MIPDALHNSHPIEMPIKKASEISEIFDDITYEKGSSVIRLLHSYIGDEAFRTGLANYHAEYAYKNTTTENLWSHLSRASKRENLSAILSTWTKQMGFPMLTVCCCCCCLGKVLVVFFISITIILRLNKIKKITIVY